MSKYKSNIFIYIGIEIVFLVFIYMLGKIVQLGKPIKIFIFFFNLGYIQVVNYAIAKCGDMYLKNNYHEIYYNYYNKNQYNSYPQFIAIRLLFEKSVKCQDLRRLQREALIFLIFAIASSLLSIIILCII